MKTTFTQFLIFIAAFLFASPFVLNAQNNQVFTLTADNLANGKTAELNEAGWKYHAGDEARFAEPNFDDSGWETLKNSALTKDSLPQTGWNGSGWFRLHLNVAPELVDNPLNFEVGHLGASEIYLDGRLIKKYGMVGDTAERETPYNPNAKPLSATFASAGAHVLAVRYSNRVASSLDGGYGAWLVNEKSFSSIVGFRLRVKNFDEASDQGWSSFGSYLTFTSAIYLAFGVLHFLLFVLYPRQRGNLFYGLFLFCSAFNGFTFSAFQSVHFGVIGFYRLNLLNECLYLSAPIFLLAFIYTDFYGRIPRRLWFFVLVVVMALLFFAVFNNLVSTNWTSFAAVILIAIEMIRIMLGAIRNKTHDAWIVTIGVFLFPIAIFKDLIGDVYPLPANLEITLDAAGFYGILLSITIYLARQFARTSTNLDAQLVKEVEHERDKARFLIVEAENERRAKELEEARQLQLSMLPKKLPVIPNLEIAAYMKTATEVGGDYYDFHVSDDGTLTVAVGDATGHGLKAGSVVTATKSLFNAFAKQNDIPQILKEISQALKQMNLRGLFMAMTLLKIKDNQVNLSIAGMPSALIYRRENNQVEEIAIRAMPLGSIAKTNYQEKEFTLEVGDVVVLMSDGFPEMFNVENEMLGFGKAAEILPQIAMNSPQEIINRLVQTSEDWANGRAQDDDVTFVVLKVGVNGN